MSGWLSKARDKENRMSYRDTEWQDEAACRGYTYFADWPLKDQLEVCGDCTVKKECVELGLSTVATVKDALDGPVFGGLHPAKFAELVRARGQRAGRFGGPR